MLKVAIFLSFLVQFCSSNHLKDGNNTFRFANTFGSNMVLQRAPLNSKLWGFGEEGQTVQLKLGENTQTFRTTVKKDQNGNSTWSIQLPAMKAGGPYTITAISFIKGFTVTISIENVLFGDVWMCAGQSNMELTVPQAFTGELELAEYADNRPNIRIFTITPKYSLKVPLVDFNQDGITQNWTVASREALTGPAWAYFSAVCWMYGRRLYDQYKIPIGLIQGDWGGTSAEAWSSPDALLKCGLTKTDDSVNLRRPKTKKSDKQSKENKEMDGSEDFLLKQVFKGSHLGESFPDSTMMRFWKRFDEKIHDSKTKLKMKKDIKSFVSKTKGMVSKFLNRVKNAHQNFQKRKGQLKHRIPKQIKSMMVSKDSLNAPGPENNHSALWNGMMAPFTRSTIKGVVWYQGEENNFVNPHLYACVFPEMINDWRKKWFEGTNGSTDQMFPFGFVQLASITDQKSLDSKYFPRIRYEQTANYGYVPNPKQQNVFMAVAMDLPDDNSPFGSIHPRDKATVADRLILGARATVYGEPDVNYRGPAIDRCLITRYQEQSVLRVDYKHLAGGIYLKSYNGFEILTTGSTAWISTEIITVTEDKQSVLVTLPSPPDIKILGVRYAWAHHPCEYKNCAVYSVNNDLPSPQDICFIP